jgi:metacaspase-1
MEQITNNYNNNVIRLRQQLISNIQFIIRQRRINNIRKRAIINSLINNYNRQLRELTANYQRQLAELRAVRTTPSKFALLVGINYKNTEHQLFGCINDALNIKALLQNQYNYENNNIRLLTDDTQMKPTRQNILNELTKMLEQSIQGDKLVFSFSGHGSQILDKSGDELDGLDELIIPIDLKYILDDELKAILDKHLKEGVELFALIDSCHSGTALDLKYNYLDSENSENSENITINPNVNETKGQAIMISGCSDPQYSIDALLEDASGNTTNAGAMTFAFLHSLEHFNYTNVSYKNLVLKMRELLNEAQLTQIPQLSSGKLINIETQVLHL